jgi:hypothetical protein
MHVLGVSLGARMGGHPRRAPCRADRRAGAGGRPRCTPPGGLTVRVGRAVVADVSAPSLFREFLPADAVSPRLRADLQHFVCDTPVLKLNWALDRPIPWRNRAVVGAGTVHLGADEMGLGRRPRVADPAGLAVPAVRSDDHLRPVPLTGRDGERVGLHPHAPGHFGRRRCGPARRPGGHGAGGPRSRRHRRHRQHRGTPGAAARRHAGGRREPGARRGERWHRAAVPAAGVPPRSGSRVVRDPVQGPYLGSSPRHTPAAGCTVSAGGSPPGPLWRSTEGSARCGDAPGPRPPSWSTASAARSGRPAGAATRCCAAPS